jgi:hypothetical protein
MAILTQDTSTSAVPKILVSLISFQSLFLPPKCTKKIFCVIADWWPEFLKQYSAPILTGKAWQKLGRLVIETLFTFYARAEAKFAWA